MAFEDSDMDKRRNLPEFARDNRLVNGGIGQDMQDFLLKDGIRPEMEDERRVRREIANSNERRRMQSINAGFASLRKIIPCTDGDKVSKAAILQQTVDYVGDLEHEKARLMSQTTQLKHLLSEVGRDSRDSDTSSQGSPPPKRKKRDTESSDEGISLGFEDQTVEDLRKELIEIRLQLDRERRLRLALEERNRNLEKMYGDRPPYVKELILAHPAYRQKQVYFEDQPRPEPMIITPVLGSSLPLPATVTLANSRLIESSQPQEIPGSRSKQYVEESSSVETESSMSRRNLETIVEAIRHLEGEHVLEDNKVRVRKMLQEESEKDTSSMTTSDQDDGRSDSSGRDSPVSYRHVSTAIKQEAIGAQTVTYPIATQLLQHRPLHEQIQRPGVIVQTS